MTAQRVLPAFTLGSKAMTPLMGGALGHDHELAQGYEDVVDPSVYVRFPLTSGPLQGKADLLVWTTTPWTLVSNTTVAAHPDVTYVVASKGDDTLVVAEPLAEKVLGEDWKLGPTFSGRQMEG